MNEVVPVYGFAEPFSSITHLAGAIVFSRLTIFPIRQVKIGLELITAFIFTASCAGLLSLSAIHHFLPSGGSTSALFQRLDHAAIFGLIAATFTPVHANLFSGFLRWGMLSIVWTLASIGIVMKLLFFEFISEELSLVLYISLGWLGLVAAVALFKRYGFEFIRPLVWGGIAYTVGALLEFIVHPVLIPAFIGPHEVFHIAVLTGITYHWIFVRRACNLLPSESGQNARQWRKIRTETLLP